MSERDNAHSVKRATGERFEIFEFDSGMALDNGEPDATTIGVAIWDNLTDSPYHKGDNQMISFSVDELDDNGLPLGVDGAKLKLEPILKEIQEKQSTSPSLRETLAANQAKADAHNTALPRCELQARDSQHHL